MRIKKRGFLNRFQILKKPKISFKFINFINLNGPRRSDFGIVSFSNDKWSSTLGFKPSYPAEG
ncbi:MAG: hypothetical protein ACFE8A_05260 [Candidatus Hodarchaeota archaeon]